MYTRKELNGMFTEGQLVIYGGEGVCRIAAVGPSSLSGTDKTKLYYTLTPLTRSGTVLTPVDTKVLMRPILTRQEAEDLIAQLPQLPPEEPESRSMRMFWKTEKMMEIMKKTTGFTYKSRENGTCNRRRNPVYST